MSLPKKNSSVVWRYFRRDPNTPDVAICTICKNPYKRSNGTTNLLDHLKRKHYTVINRHETLQQTEDDDNTLAGK